MIVWLLSLLVWFISHYNLLQVNTETVVEIKWFSTWALANDIATIFYSWGWIDMVTTMIGENWGFNKDIVSITNDHWLCQLNYKRHKDFINSPWFRDPVTQANYCVEVWHDAIKKNRLNTTFYAYNHRSLYKDRVTVIEKTYYKIFWEKIYIKS